MKKIISYLLILTLILGVFPQIVFSAEDEYFFFESFENVASGGKLPEGWTHSGKTLGENYYVCDDEITASHGKNVLYIYDEHTSNSNHNYSDYRNVTPGDNLGLIVDAYILWGEIMAGVEFLNEKKARISLNNMTMQGSEKSWKKHQKEILVPDNAKYMRVWVYTNSTTEGEGYVDNVRVVKDFVYIKSEDEITLDPPTQATPVNSKLVEPSGDKLIYNAYDKENGDKLSDFSYAGYYKGEIALPDTSKLAQFATISPKTGSEATSDMRSEIQKVIDEANAKYNETGKVQVITLKKGKYYVSATSTIVLQLKSGVVLKGEGQDEEGTVIYSYTTNKNYAIRIQGSAPTQIGEIAYVRDTYIPAGSKVLTIDEERISDFSVGDLITIHHPTDDEWCQAMDMQGENMTYTYPANDPDYPGKTNNTSWNPDDDGIQMMPERTITKIEGNKITVDFPFFVPYDTRYSKVYIYKTNDSGRYHDAGVENLRIESYYNGKLNDDAHAHIGIYIKNAKNCFVRDVSTKYIRHSAVSCDEGAKQITVQNVSCLQPVSVIEGGNRYSFYTGRRTQQIVFIGCYSYDGRHDYCTSYASTGPTVFTDSVVDASNSQSETHGSWSTGALYDNIISIGSDTKGFIASTNRGTMGTSLSQGWSGAGIVAWNCLSNAIIYQKPPMTYQNFMIGQWGFYDDVAAASKKSSFMSGVYNYYKTNSIPAKTAPKTVIGTKDGTSFVGDAYKESEFAPVNPRSLYKAQLAERITGSYKNFKPNAPVITNPRSENTEESNTVEIKGMYQKGATAVTIYIDNTPYNATLNSYDYTFSLKTTLTTGTHKVFATQTIDGIASTKCADRFIHVRGMGNRFDYLSSDYNRELTNPLLNDKRLTYDQYEQQKINLNVSISSDVIVYGETAKITLGNAAYFSDIQYTTNTMGIADISNDGIVSVRGIGKTNITVSGKHTNGCRYSETISVTTAKRQAEITSVNFETGEAVTENLVNSDKLTYDFKYKLKTAGEKTSVATIGQLIVTGERADCYDIICNVETEVPSEYIVMKGSGTVNDPYIIDNDCKFENVFASFGDTAIRSGYKYFLQTEDIKLNNYKTNSSAYFRGHYNCGNIDENGEITYEPKKITVEASGTSYMSLFGRLNNGHIENIDVYGNIKGTSSYAGAVASTLAASSIKNCNNYALVQGGSCSGGIAGKIENNSIIAGCSNNNNMAGTSYAGGIVGYMATGSSVLGGVNYGDITTSSSYSGGIVGCATQNTEIILCENHGNLFTKGYSGGILGYSIVSGTVTEVIDTHIKKCSNFGRITSSSTNVGGILGNAEGKDKITYISECFNIGDVYASNNVGGIAGYVYSSNESGSGLSVTDCYNLGIVAATVKENIKSGFIVGLHSGLKGLTITNCFDLRNSLDSIGGVSGYTYSGTEYTVPEPVVSDVYIEKSGNYSYAATKTRNELKDLVSNGKFSDSVWENSKLITYPMLKWASNGISTHYSDKLGKLIVIPRANAGVYIASYGEDGTMTALKMHTLKNVELFDILSGNKVFIWNNNLMPLKNIFEIMEVE